MHTGRVAGCIHAPGCRIYRQTGLLGVTHHRITKGTCALLDHGPLCLSSCNLTHRCAGLTLPIMSIQPVTTAVRGLGATLLSPHPLCVRDPSLCPTTTLGDRQGEEDVGGKRKRALEGKGEGRLALCVPAIDCVVSLQVVCE